MSAADPIIVVGGGIGGLTAALALARRGKAVAVLERRMDAGEEGAGIQLSPNASRVLTRLGLDEPLSARAVLPGRIVIRALAGGRTLATIPLGRHARERYGAPYRVVHRADLHAILRGGLDGNVAVSLGHEVIGATVTDKEAQLSVRADGAAPEARAAPLVIGADGLWSVIRRSLGHAAEPRFQNLSAWRATLPLSAAPLSLRGNDIGLWLGPDAHVVHYPVAAGELLNMVVIERASLPVDGWSAPGDGTALAARLVNAAAPLYALIAAAPAWRQWSLYDLDPPRPWHRGRLVLLGDAAHPILPFLAQGGALAIEDAAVLAEKLSAPGRVEDALHAYEHARRDRALRISAAARASGRLYHLPGLPSLARDLAMRAMGGERLLRRYDWIYRWPTG